MRLTITSLALAVAVVSPTSGLAQPQVRITEPHKLAYALPELFGEHGLFVDSSVTTLDGHTHSDHFNGSFESAVGPLSTALASQLVAVPTPPPVSVAGYGFDSTGLFTPSQQHFGFVFSERAELIGKSQLALGFSVRHTQFESLDGLDLGAIPATFTHDGFEAGGGRTDVVTTVNTLDLRLTQYTGFLSYGLTEWVDLSVSVPLVQTDLTITSLASLQRLGTSASPQVHFFEGQTGERGTSRTYIAGGRATGIGDITVRLKGRAADIGSSRVALGVDARLPIGDEENLLGLGAAGVRPFVVWSHAGGTVSPHASLSYQWNGESFLAGDITAHPDDPSMGEHGHSDGHAFSEAGDFPDEIAYGLGAAVAITHQSSVTFDILGRHVFNTLRLTPEDFVASTGDRFANINFVRGSLSMVNAAIGFSVRTPGAMSAYAGVLFALNESGLRKTVIPMVGLQRGF